VEKENFSVKVVEKEKLFFQKQKSGSSSPERE
jgi:hypothetical protein